MKLAKASQSEIDALMKWLQDRENKEDGPPPYMRVVFGYETLVQNVCDPDKDYLDWKSGTSPSEIAILREDKARLDYLDLQHPEIAIRISRNAISPPDLRMAIDAEIEESTRLPPA